MLDGDGVQGFEAVNDSEFGASGGAIRLLDDCKPTRSVGGIRRLIDSSSDLGFDESAYFVVDAWWNRNIALNPGLVFDYRHINWWEEVLAETSAFRIVPGESHLL